MIYKLLQFVVTVFQVIIFKNTVKEFVWKGMDLLIFFTFFCIIAIVKSNMLIENDYSFLK